MIYHRIVVVLFIMVFQYDFNFLFNFNMISKYLQVLPRQSCGLYTNTRNYTSYPNGSRRLEQYLMGGKLFRTILTNPVINFNCYSLFFEFSL